MNLNCEYNTQKLGRVVGAGFFIRLACYLLYLFDIGRDNAALVFIKNRLKKHYQLTNHKDYSK